METAVGDISDAMKSGPKGNTLSRWLFPTAKNFTDIPSRWVRDLKTHEVLKWKDKDLNEEQKASMSQVVPKQSTDKE